MHLCTPLYPSRSLCPTPVPLSPVNAPAPSETPNILRTLYHPPDAPAIFAAPPSPPPLPSPGVPARPLRSHYPRKRSPRGPDPALGPCMARWGRHRSRFRSQPRFGQRPPARTPAATSSPSPSSARGPGMRRERLGSARLGTEQARSRGGPGAERPSPRRGAVPGSEPPGPREPPPRGTPGPNTGRRTAKERIQNRVGSGNGLPPAARLHPGGGSRGPGRGPAARAAPPPRSPPASTVGSGHGPGVLHCHTRLQMRDSILLPARDGSWW